MKLLLAAASVAVLASSAFARCPNDCSGKGTCGNYDKCECYPGYTGGDCGQRVCLYGRAWGDAPHDDGLAHDYLECSGNGICDRSTGQCQCNDGFVGDACRYSACPNSCNGHGTCEYVEETAADSTVQYQAYEDTKYNLWDAGKTRQCKCDSGWSGYDCSERMCPRGNDPLTTHTTDAIGANTIEVPEVQTVNIQPHFLKTGYGAWLNIGGEFTLTYTDAYNQEWTTRPIRVTTQVTGAVSTTATVEITDGGAKIADRYQRLDELFQLYDSVHISGGTGSRDSVHRITGFDGTGYKADIEPSIGATDDGTGNGGLKIRLVNADTGEIGVKRKLMELPNQVIPSITVDETITDTTNVFRITFSDSANSGDQHLLTCKVGSCDTDGCQPRKDAMMGIYGYVGTDVTVASNAFSVGTRLFTELVDGQTIVSLTNMEAADEQATGTITSASSKTHSTITGITNTGTANANNAVVVKFTFTDDSYGYNGYTIGNQDGSDITIEHASASGRNSIKLPDNTALTGFTAGTRVYLECATNAQNNGFYRIEEAEDSSTENIYLDRQITAVASGTDKCFLTVVTDSPCTVTESRKGTSELASCSNRGNCDTTTGLCACFPGYMDEDCSVQTTLV